MKQIRIMGKNKLTGTISISGAKNSAVALVPAAILSDGIVTISNIPNISDIEAIKNILKYLSVTITDQKDQLKIDSKDLHNKCIPEQLSSKLRASYYFMGALLGKFHEVEMYFPGGCTIGARPIDLHLSGFEALGATITNDGNKYMVKAERLVGTDLYVKHSVGATINLLLASVLAQGTTTIHDAAREPEIGNVIDLLNSMGANISGKDTDTLTIEGVEILSSGNTEVIPDRIEAGTYIIAGALCGDNLTIANMNTEHVTALLEQLQKMGSNLQISATSVTISQVENLQSTAIKTQVYPGFPTDLQQPMVTLLTTCSGISTMEETIYENRFKNIFYLQTMGAKIEIQDRILTIHGGNALTGATVLATDLRAGASLVLAGLIADGTTIIDEVEHILRGYDNIIEKLSNVGAKISLEEI